MKKKNFKQSIVIMLIFAIILTSTQFNVKAIDNNIGVTSQRVYVDGEEFIVTTNLDDGVVTVESADKSDESILEITESGEASASVFDASEEEFVDYVLDIEDLSEENLDIEVIDENGNVVEMIDEYDDLIDDSYDGQAATVTVITAVTVETLITALLVSAACIAIAGVIYYGAKAAVKEIEKSKEQKKYYYKAYIYNKNVFINLNRISKTSAISRIKNGKNIYTYTKSLAKDVTKVSGLGVSSPDISCFKGKKVKFYHYHTSPKNGSHIFYGVPVIE